MTLGEREVAMLAELKDMPSFVLLVSLFKEFELDVLSELALVPKSEELVRISRFYQCLRAIREFLETRPQAAASELARIKETFFIDQEIGVPVDVFRQRFNPVPETSQDL